MKLLRVSFRPGRPVRASTRRIKRIQTSLAPAWVAFKRALPPLELIQVKEKQRPFFTALHDLLDQESEITLGGLVDSAGEQTCGLLVLLMALPSLVPGFNLGAAPVGGLGIMATGLQMAWGTTLPWIPDRIRRQPIHKGRMKGALAKLEGYLTRFGGKRENRRALSYRWMGLVVTWAGFLLFLPVPLPFGNQLPAITLIVLGAALLEERPFWGWLGTLICLANTIYFAVFFNLIARECLRVIHALNHWLS